MTITRAVLCGLLGVSALGHLVGTFLFYPLGSEIFVWSLSGAGFAFSTLALNVFATSRRTTHLVVACIAAIGWGIVCILFGFAIGAIGDPRVLAHLVAAFGLAALNIYQMIGRSGLVAHNS